MKVNKNNKNNKKDNYRYDYSLRKNKERAAYIEDRIDYIFKMEPHEIMGYSSNSRRGEHKYNRIPEMIDRYTTYFLESRDIESSASREYRYYVDEHNEFLRKGNVALYRDSHSFDGGTDSRGGELTDYSQSYIDEDRSYMGYVDYGYEDTDSRILKYALKNNRLDISDYKKVLSDSVRIMMETKDEELKELVEQLVFNCVMCAVDSVDADILRGYITGASLREISGVVEMSHVAVSKRLNNMLRWV